MTPSPELAGAKAEYDLQTFDLFEELDPPPVLRRGAEEYILQLRDVPFHDDSGASWAFWHLAPPDRRWDSWARHVARDRDRSWIDGVEHVWLTHDGRLHQALVEIHTGAILQSRPFPMRSATPPEGHQP